MAQLMMTSAYNNNNHRISTEHHPLSRQQQQQQQHSNNDSGSGSGSSRTKIAGGEKLDDHNHSAVNLESSSSSSSYPTDHNYAFHGVLSLQQQTSSASSRQRKLEGDIDVVAGQSSSSYDNASAANATTTLTTSDCSVTASSSSLDIATTNPIAKVKKQRKRTRHVRSSFVFCGNGDLFVGMANVGRSEHVFGKGGGRGAGDFADVFGGVAGSSTTNNSVVPTQNLATSAAGRQALPERNNGGVFDTPNFDPVTSDRSVDDNLGGDDDDHTAIMDIEKTDSSPHDEKHPSSQIVDDGLKNDSASDFINALQTGVQTGDYDMDFVFDR